MLALITAEWAAQQHDQNHLKWTAWSRTMNVVATTIRALSGHIPNHKYADELAQITELGDSTEIDGHQWKFKI